MVSLPSQAAEREAALHAAEQQLLRTSSASSRISLSDPGAAAADGHAFQEAAAGASSA